MACNVSGNSVHECILNSLNAEDLFRFFTDFQMTGKSV